MKKLKVSLTTFLYIWVLNFYPLRIYHTKTRIRIYGPLNTELGTLFQTTLSPIFGANKRKMWAQKTLLHKNQLNLFPNT